MVEELFRKKYLRRAFVIIVLVVILSLGLIRFLLAPLYDASVAATFWGTVAILTQGLLFSFVTTVFVGLLIFWLVPEKPDPATIILNGKEISETLEGAMTRTSFWWYKGGAGRYLRAVTIPKLANFARRTSSTRELRVQLLHPANADLCAAYALYRSGLSSAASDDEPWTSERVRNELLATILKLCVTKHENPLLNVKLSFTSTFSTFRIDLSEDDAIITREDPREAAFRFAPASPFYSAYREEFNAAMLQARECPLRPPPSEMTPTGIRNWLASLGVFTELPEETSYAEILNKYRESKNPYG